MKQLTTIFSLLFILSLISVQNIAAQVQVRIGVPPPRVVVIERPVCPGRDYVGLMDIISMTATHAEMFGFLGNGNT